MLLSLRDSVPAATVEALVEALYAQGQLSSPILPLAGNLMSLQSAREVQGLRRVTTKAEFTGGSKSKLRSSKFPVPAVLGATVAAVPVAGRVGALGSSPKMSSNVLSSWICAGALLLLLLPSSAPKTSAKSSSTDFDTAAEVVHSPPPSRKSISRRNQRSTTRVRRVQRGSTLLAASR